MLREELPSINWYGFGSYFKGQLVFGDIDILVVCRSPQEATKIRTQTAKLCERWPLHLLIMTEDEALETNFIAAENCKLLWPLHAQ